MTQFCNRAFNYRVKIFYVVTAVFVVTCIVQLYILINKPKYKTKNASTKSVPTLEVEPIADASLKTVFIKYDENDISTIDKWIYLLDSFLEGYSMEDAGPYAKLAESCDFNRPPEKGYICPVDINKFGPCSPPYYGFYSFSPCVFLKLSKIYRWTPECYNNSKSLPASMPKDLVEQIKREQPRNASNQVWVSCSGIHDADKEHVGQFNYYPSRGFPAYFYPITFRTGKQLSPLIAVEIVNPKPGVLINIECRIWAKNIEYRGGSPKERLGSVEFIVMRDERNQDYGDYARNAE